MPWGAASSAGAGAGTGSTADAGAAVSSPARIRETETAMGLDKRREPGVIRKCLSLGVRVGFSLAGARKHGGEVQGGAEPDWNRNVFRADWVHAHFP